MCQELGPFACQMHAAPEQVAGGPHRGGIDIGLREHAATEQGGNLLGIDLVVFGLTAMDGLHGEGMTEDKRDAFVGTEVGEPVPGEHTFDRDDDPSRYGAMAFRKVSGSAFILRCTRISPLWSRMQTYMVRACRSMPQ